MSMNQNRRNICSYLSCYIRNSSTNAVFTEFGQLSYIVILQHQFVITKLRNCQNGRKKQKRYLALPYRTCGRLNQVNHGEQISFINV